MGLYREENVSLKVALLLVGLIQCVTSKSLDGTDSLTDASPEVWANQAVLVGIVVTVCAILLLMGCAEFCQKETAFKDFENEDTFQNEVVDPSPASQFSMYPPVESTPEAMLTTPIIFEPLPSIDKLKPRVSNATLLRPKVGTLSGRMGRADSEDSLEEAIQRDGMQDKMKLQNLLTNSRNQLPRSQLQYIKELGSGYFGKVLQGEGQKILPGHKKTKVVIQMLKEEADPHEQLTFLQEATPYREVDHPNVLKVLGQCVETMPYLVVLELCPFGDLKTYLRSHRVAMESFNEKGLLLKFACDMAAGLQALHQGNFCHHDLAIRNCLLASDLTVKIGDYGHSEEIFKEDYYFDANNDAIPIRWLAPESLGYSKEGALTVKKINKEANLWSYGVCLWEIIMFGSMPYSDLSNEHVLRLVISEKSLKLPKPDIPVKNIDRIYQLMQLCWSEPSQRPSLRELRIMLLHLMSRKVNTDSTAFEHKWEQLMPRRTPQVTQVAPPAQSGPIQTVAANHSVEPLTTTSRPSGFESNFVELNVGQLAQQAGGVSLADELAQVHGPPEDASTPKNELSLEAELSAAFATKPEADNEDDDDDGFGELTSAEPVVSEVSIGGELSAIKAEDASHDEQQDSARTEDSQQSDHTLIGDMIKVTVEDESADQNIPDIVATSTIQPGNDASPDFMTSTPKKPEEVNDSGSDALIVTANSNLLDTGTTSPSYHTAMTTQRTTSTGSSVSEDELSLFGQKKFAALLQTVAAPSFDGDDIDPSLSSSFDSSNLEKSIEEEPEFVKYEQLNSYSNDYKQVPTNEANKSKSSEIKQEQTDELLLDIAPKAVNGNDKTE